MLIVRDKSGNGYGVGFVYRAKAEGNLQGVGYSDSAALSGEFNVELRGAFVATLRLVRSFDNGTTWQPLTVFGNLILFTAPCEETFTEYEPGVLYAWQCTAYTSGTIYYRISQ